MGHGGGLGEKGRGSERFAQHTDGSRLDHVADCESLDRLVLGCTSRAIGAADRLGLARLLELTDRITGSHLIRTWPLL